MLSCALRAQVKKPNVKVFFLENCAFNTLKVSKSYLFNIKFFFKFHFYLVLKAQVSITLKGHLVRK